MIQSYSNIFTLLEWFFLLVFLSLVSMHLLSTSAVLPGYRSAQRPQIPSMCFQSHHPFSDRCVPTSVCTMEGEGSGRHQEQFENLCKPNKRGGGVLPAVAQLQPPNKTPRGRKTADVMFCGDWCLTNNYFELTCQKTCLNANFLFIHTCILQYICFCLTPRTYFLKLFSRLKHKQIKNTAIL